jgi:hypothetical protein
VIQVVFETHSTSADNERGVASGWSHSRLSARGRNFAREPGRRRRHDGIDAVFSSDLRRAARRRLKSRSGQPPSQCCWTGGSESATTGTAIAGPPSNIARTKPSSSIPRRPKRLGYTRIQLILGQPPLHKCGLEDVDHMQARSRKRSIAVPRAPNYHRPLSRPLLPVIRIVHKFRIEPQCLEGSR